MYEIIATKDFIDVLKKLSIEYASVLTRSFVSIREIPTIETDNTFLIDLISEINKQEVA